MADRDHVRGLHHDIALRVQAMHDAARLLRYDSQIDGTMRAGLVDDVRRHHHDLGELLAVIQEVSDEP